MDIETDDMPTPGRRMGPGRPRKTATKVVPDTIPDARLHAALSEYMVYMSMGVGLFDKACLERKTHDAGYESCSDAIASQADTVAKSLVEASKKNPALRKILNQMVTVGVFGQIGAALLPVLFTIARNHVINMPGPDPIPEGYANVTEAYLAGQN